MWAQWLLLILYAGVGVTNVARGVLGFVVGPVIAGDVPYFPWLSGIYVAWGIVFLGVCAVYLVRKVSFALWPVLGIGTAYQATLWAIKLIAERASYARSLWLRELLLTFIFIGGVSLLGWVAATWSPSAGQRRGRR